MPTPRSSLPMPSMPMRVEPPIRAEIDSRELLAGAREIVIRHGDSEYRLRHTQNDKLILTK